MRSAEVIVPLVLRLVQLRSVIDVGCGDGSWLAVFHRCGVEDVLGLDGEYVDRALLQIPPDRFQPCDLSGPFHVGRDFDLAMSLEVAEHLPADLAPGFVARLTDLAPLVLFSAAIPFQDGTHHVNEQWPDKWAALFRAHDYVPIDFLRKQIWQNDAVEYWYVQNTLLFARQEMVERGGQLKEELEKTNLNQLCLVHPKQYADLNIRYTEAIKELRSPRMPSGVKEASRLLLVCVKNSLMRKFGSE